MTVVGPMPCLTCRREVFWDRIGSQWRLMEKVAKTARRHTCRHKPTDWRGAPRCGAVMPVLGETCARTAGHRDSHRSRYDLDNQIRARRAGFAA